LLPIGATAEEIKLGPGGCLVVSNLEFTRATGNPLTGQGPHLRGTVQNTCSQQMTLRATAFFLNGKNEVGYGIVIQKVAKGLTAIFDSFAATPESVNSTTASLSDAKAFEH